MPEVLFHLLFGLASVGLAVWAARSERRVFAAIGGSLVAVLVSLFAGERVFSMGMAVFAAMRLLSGFLLWELPIFIAVSIALAPPAWRARRLVGGLIIVVIELVGLDAFLVEPHALETRFEVVRTSRIDAPLRVVVLSDVQTDAPGAFEEEVIRRADALHPDLVLLPGDYVQLPGGAEYLAAARRLGGMFDTLHPPLGTFAVRGNVEHRDFVRDLFEGTRIRAFDETTRIDVGPIDLLALSFEDSFDPLLTWPASDRFLLVFGHGPDFMLGDVRGELLVAGHTHGGQLQIPFFGPPLTLSSVPRAWGAGGHWEEPAGRHLVISRGVGMERGPAPRFRFLCRPEMVVIDLVPTD